MPAAFARSASRAPALLACSIGLSERRSDSVQWTEASVRPESSSTSWAKMPRFERKTLMRGRSAEPCTFARPLLADDRGDLADLLLGVALDDHPRRLGHLELDALRRFDRHGVRVPERELEVAALELGAIADALDLQGLREAVGDAFHHVRHERAGEPVQGPVLGAVGGARDDQRPVLLAHLDRARLALEEIAAGSGHADDLGLDRHGDAGGDGDGLLADTTHNGVTRPAPRPRRRRPPCAHRGP